MVTTHQTNCLLHYLQHRFSLHESRHNPHKTCVVFAQNGSESAKGMGICSLCNQKYSPNFNSAASCVIKSTSSVAHNLNDVATGRPTWVPGSERSTDRQEREQREDQQSGKGQSNRKGIYLLSKLLLQFKGTIRYYCLRGITTNFPQRTRDTLLTV